MSNIEYIKNVVAFNSFGEEIDEVMYPDLGVFTMQLNTLPDFSPDEIIIRSINYNRTFAYSQYKEDPCVFLLRANFANNDIIASFPGGTSITTSPQTVIKMVTPIPNYLEFQIHTPDGRSLSRLVDDFVGDLVIHLDFIKYKRER